MHPPSSRIQNNLISNCSLRYFHKNKVKSGVVGLLTTNWFTGLTTCTYTSDTASELATAAFAFLLLAHLILSGITRCLCCGALKTYKSRVAHCCTTTVFVISWSVGLSITRRVWLCLYDNWLLSLHWFSLGLMTVYFPSSSIHSLWCSAVIFSRHLGLSI